MFCHLLNAVKRLVNLAVTLETERNGNDTYRQDAQFFTRAGNHRSSTSTRTTAHSGCDERHLGAVAKHVLNISETLFCCLTCLLGLVSGTKALLTQLQMHGYWRVVKCLVVGVAEHEGYIMNTLAIHVVYCIAATTANTYHFNYAVLFFGITEIQYHIVWHSLLFLCLLLSFSL